MLLAFTVSSFVYLSFANVYSSDIFGYEKFESQFNSGIYQYRKLSTELISSVYYFLNSSGIDFSKFKLKFIDPKAEPPLYLSFYIVNTFFLVLSAGIMVLITNLKSFIATSTEKILITGISIFVMAFSQFVIVPYDVSSYFFLLLFFYILIKYLEKKSTIYLIFLFAILIVSTINRESSAISISLAATLLYAKFGLKKESLIPVFGLAIVFILTYIGLRMFNGSFTTNDGSLISKNIFEPKNLLGLLSWVVLFTLPMLLAKDRFVKRQILTFHLLAAPYLAMCFYTGILYEVRLYVPLFLTSVLLSKLEVKKIVHFSN